MRDFLKKPLWRAVETDDVLTMGNCLLLTVYSLCGIYFICKKAEQLLLVIIDKIMYKDTDTEE